MINLYLLKFVTNKIKKNKYIILIRCLINSLEKQTGPTHKFVDVSYHKLSSLCINLNKKFHEVSKKIFF